MLEWQQRVVEEKLQVEQRHGKLVKFFAEESGELPDEDIDLLYRQASIMTEYINILKKRIARFDQ